MIFCYLILEKISGVVLWFWFFFVSDIFHSVVLLFDTSRYFLCDLSCVKRTEGLVFFVCRRPPPLAPARENFQEAGEAMSSVSDVLLLRSVRLSLWALLVSFPLYYVIYISLQSIVLFTCLHIGWWAWRRRRGRKSYWGYKRWRCCWGGNVMPCIVTSFFCWS